MVAEPMLPEAAAPEPVPLSSCPLVEERLEEPEPDVERLLPLPDRDEPLEGELAEITPGVST